MSQGQSSADNRSVVKASFKPVCDALFLHFSPRKRSQAEEQELWKTSVKMPQFKKCRSAFDVDMQICSFYPIQSHRSPGVMQRL